jgi:hypothetical protein
MSSTSFNLMDVIAVLQKRWKSVSIFVLISLVIAAATLWVVPKYYRASIVVMPASPVLADKARLFNTNIQSLYSFFGNGDDTETLMGIAQLDTNYYQLIDEFKLINYYDAKGETDQIKRKSCLKLLQKDIEVSKTEFNQLKIVVWNKQADQSVAIANRLIDLVQQTEQNVWKQAYQNSVNRLQESIADLENQYKNIADSLQVNSSSFRKDMFETQRQSILEQIKIYQKSVNEFKLAIATTPASLYVIEKAMPSASPDKPVFIMSLIMVLFASIAFGIIAALIFERKESAQ